MSVDIADICYHEFFEPIYPEVPPRVEYELTGSAKKLLPICKQLSDWGTGHKEVHEKA